MFNYAKCIAKEISNTNFTLDKVYRIKDHNIETNNGFASLRGIKEFNGNGYFSEFEIDLCTFKLVDESEYHKSIKV